MLLKTAKKTIITGAIVMISMGSAQALTLDPVGADNQTYTFSGTFDLGYGSVIFTGCSLALTGHFDTASSTMTFTDSTVSGQYPCASFNITGLDQGNVDNLGADGGQVTVNSVDIAVATFFTCGSDSLVLDFHNDGNNPSYFTIPQQSLGDCYVETRESLPIVSADSYSGDMNITN